MTDKYENLWQEKPVTVKITCDSCIFFKNAAYYSDGHRPQPCAVLGRTAKQTPCPAFQINPYDIDFNNNAVMIFSKLSMLTPPDKLALLAALLTQENTTRKYGYYFGQNVYVRIYPQDFISNWATAKVLFANSNNVHIQGKRGFRASMKHDSVFSEVRWLQHERYLRSVGRLVDPQLKDYQSYNGHKINLMGKATIPTIDQFNNKDPAVLEEEVTPVRKRGRPKKQTAENKNLDF